ncbi:glutamine-hydrolyzing GMP synthase [Candidatus Bandiella euplotis]|nr:glutamine-hydrolyzing GMP synthase [Candidatus Bandiella woodruffii]
MNSHDKILILDFGSQFTQLITRRIRELNIYSEIKPYSISDEEIKKFNPKAIILSGGSESVTDEGAPQIPRIIYDLNVPILGICYGQQALCKDFGGIVSSSTSRSYGPAQLEILSESRLFKDFWRQGENHQVLMSHGDCISTLPKDFEVVARTDKAQYAAIEHKTKEIYGIQFHPEVSHTPDGMRLLDNFLSKIVGCKKDWEMGCFIDEQIVEMRNKVGEEKVVLGLSGGVDSTVVAALLSKAIGKQLYCVFIDNGLLRHNEVEEVQNSLKNDLDLQLITVDASTKFSSELKGVEDPEEKRKVIGRVFIETFQDTIKNLGNIRYLAQGTIYPDVIESAATSTGKKVTIKSHHNVGGLPENMGELKLIEPLRLLFKDEVRILGKKLDIPDAILNRHPFPGPGLGIRVLGEVTQEKCEILRQADHIFISMLKNRGLYHKIWQAYAALLPVKTVGVMGDARTYQYICVLRAITSIDGMTADYVDLPHELLGAVAKKIVNEVHGINRVLYDVTSKPPATIEME